MYWLRFLSVLTLLAGYTAAASAPASVLESATSKAVDSIPAAATANLNVDKNRENPKASAPVDKINAARTHGLLHKPFNLFGGHSGGGGGGYPYWPHGRPFSYEPLPFSWSSSLAAGSAASSPAVYSAPPPFVSAPVASASSLPAASFASLQQLTPAASSPIASYQPLTAAASNPIVSYQPLTAAASSPIASYQPLTAAASNPIASYQPQAMQQPGHAITDTVVHRPLIFHKTEYVRRPVFMEVVEVVHKPYFAEYVQQYKLPTYKVHLVGKPHYSAMSHESVAPPLVLKGQQYHVVEKPTAHVYQLPTQYVQPYSSQVPHVPAYPSPHLSQTNTVPIAPVVHQMPPSNSMATAQQLPALSSAANAEEPPAAPTLPATTPEQPDVSYFPSSFDYIPGGTGWPNHYGWSGNYGWPGWPVHGQGSGANQLSYSTSTSTPSCRGANCPVRNGESRNAPDQDESSASQQPGHEPEQGNATTGQPDDQSSRWSLEMMEDLIIRLFDSEEFKKSLMAAAAEAKAEIKADKQMQRTLDFLNVFKGLSVEEQKRFLKEVNEKDRQAAAVSPAENVSPIKLDKVTERSQPTKTS